ncbi:MAG: hypothetical protein AB7T49_11085 [Oligoflexales bacterium]
MRSILLFGFIVGSALNSIAVADSVVWESGNLFSEDMRLPKEKPHPKDKVLFPSNAGGGGNHRISHGMLEWDGHQTRTYLDFYRIRPLINSEIEFYAMKNEDVEDVSAKIGNHSLKGWVFGGYGCVFEGTQVKSKVEYYHNDQGTKFNVPLAQPIPAGQMIGYKVSKQNRSDGTVVMNCWVDYTGTGQNWVKVLENRVWADADWTPPSVPSGAHDSADIEKGVYVGPVQRWWIRINAINESKSANVKVKSIKISELSDLP